MFFRAQKMHIFALFGGVDFWMVGVDIVTRPRVFGAQKPPSRPQKRPPRPGGFGGGPGGPFLSMCEGYRGLRSEHIACPIQFSKFVFYNILVCLRRGNPGGGRMWYAGLPVRLWGGMGGPGRSLYMAVYKGYTVSRPAQRTHPPIPPKAGQGVLRTMFGIPEKSHPHPKNRHSDRAPMKNN